jgi:hypothetical protein
MKKLILGTGLSRHPRVVGSMGRVIAKARAEVGSAPLVGQCARRWRSPRFGGANWLASSAVATPGMPLPADILRAPTRGSGRNHWRQIAHGLFRASDMVMLHDHHASARTGWGSDQNALGQFWKAGVGQFS